jgi:hypothetical protein
MQQPDGDRKERLRRRAEAVLLERRNTGGQRSHGEDALVSDSDVITVTRGQPSAAHSGSAQTAPSLPTCDGKSAAMIMSRHGSHFASARAFRSYPSIIPSDNSTSPSFPPSWLSSIYRVTISSEWP